MLRLSHRRALSRNLGSSGPLLRLLLKRMRKLRPQHSPAGAYDGLSSPTLHVTIIGPLGRELIRRDVMMATWQDRVFLDRTLKKGEPMQSSGRMRAQITMLIIATSLIQLANGFFGTFISLGGD